MNERRKNMVIKVYETKYNDKITSNYLSKIRNNIIKDKYIRLKI